MSSMPIPVTDDVDTAGFWAAASEGRVALRTCSKCETVLHLPRAYCYICGSWESEWKEVRPLGSVYTWTTTHRELRPGVTPPYTVVLVELEDAPGIRLVGYLPGEPHLSVGMSMRAEFEKRGDATVVQWVPVASS